MTAASSTPYGMDEHPEVAEISDLTEGLLSPDRSADVRAHLSDCDLCSDVRMSLEEIRSTLGTLPGPMRMPSDIVGRIDAALAAEALLDASAPDPAPSTGADALPQREHDTPRTGGAAGGRPAVSRETARADRPAGHARGATGPGRSPRRGTRRLRGVLLGAAGTAAALTLGILLLPGMESDDGVDRASSGTAESSVEDRSDAVLGQRVRALLSDGGAGRPKQEGQPNRELMEPEGGDFSTKASPGVPAVPPCVREGIGRDEAPLAVGLEPYRGQQAYIVVLPHRSDSARVDAYAVDADCVEGAPSTPGEVIDTGTYQR